ncbi:DNA-3-methyladenine glycosylase I [Lactiplantibacillus garii]|uniref:DNA-3-methyladenine glycosylase I n=1 Tax=Lactiplantibacillus garii TaxID=2306423 RepID=A0A426D9L6_9LACO|nr:DNA-3-methyladenine glycosylase I [Lactiplantibacillus garii]RRK11298.1 DNA-3-methyladenine glycosylase I [Lactiplantibacillus garii]
MKRCAWAETSDLMRNYHDYEWGRPQRDPQKLFELLCLETYQAGLSWQTVLNKRAAFETAFDHYNVERVAAMTAADVDRLMTNASIIRNRLKLNATVNNARVIRDWPTGSTFASWLWAFVNDQPIRQAWQRADQVPATNDLAKQVSKAMKKRGFKFVGPTTVYSYLQAAGLINDHLADCDWAPENLK